MIRTQQIASALAQRHRVAVIDGGQALPFPPGVTRLSLPRISRSKGKLASLQPELSLTQAFELRARRLQEHLAAECPDIILVEHFPFSKWELSAEIDALLEEARLCNPGVKVICSLRDIAPRTRHEDPQDYSHRVLHRLNRQFDALLVHADPQLCSLGDFFPHYGEIEIPVYHTGIVAQPSVAVAPENPPGPALESGYVVASIGGGADDAGLLARVTGAWRQLRGDQTVGSLKLLLFGGLAASRSADAAAAETDDAIFAMGFDPNFRYWLQGASLSISCAGYNTCANLLRSETPALLIPNLKMSDQQERARLLAARGIAQLVPPATPDSEPLPQMILANLNGRPPRHGINIEGADNSARLIEAALSGIETQ